MKAPNPAEMPQKLLPSHQESLWPGDPFDWSVEQVSAFISLHDPAATKIASALRREEIDGPAFLLLTQANCSRGLNLTQVEIAKLCHIVEAAKTKFAQLHIEPYL
ncbi:scm-like with four MBT domains protein 2 [Galendromus occidentalis]|uniref:Scm-like with four MBT domains protein 2 n=1 Tax=Galendromus occidentalis TaxID=34638 RepID=A0AAJ6QQ85_9ACAR|nr:scm-like with four MBT domains protein 2 [Galendromus occidentalis]